MLFANGPRRIACAAVLFALHCGPDYHDHDDLNEAVVSCEDAFARLESCCPGFNAGLSGDGNWNHRCLDMKYSEKYEGCEGGSRSESGHVLPALSVDESRCIRSTTCDDLRTKRVCERARYVDARGSGKYERTDPEQRPQTITGSIDKSHPDVCP